MNETTKKWRLKKGAFAAKAGTVYELRDDGSVEIELSGQDDRTAYTTAYIIPSDYPDWFERVCGECKLPPCSDGELCDPLKPICHGHPAPEPVVPKVLTLHTLVPSYSSTNGYVTAYICCADSAQAEELKLAIEQLVRVTGNRIRRDAEESKLGGKGTPRVMARVFIGYREIEERIMTSEAEDLIALLRTVLGGGK